MAETESICIARESISFIGLIGLVSRGGLDLDRLSYLDYARSLLKIRKNF